MSLQISRGLLARLNLGGLNLSLDEVLVHGSRAVDLAYARLVNAPFTTPFFENGWGDLDIVDFKRDGWMLSNGAAALAGSNELINWLQWRKLEEGTKYKTRYELYEGVFETPVQGRVRYWLPPESLVGRVRLLRPKDHPRPALVVHLAGTGDHGWQRRLAMGFPLIQDGIAALVLESPFYGKRRPVQQVRSKLRHVCDLLALGRVTIEETQRLLLWARKEGFGSLGIAGFSMGGVHAAMTACLHPEPVACAPLCAPHSAAEPYCHQSLWKATKAAKDPKVFTGRVEFESGHGKMDDVYAPTASELARERLARALEITDVTKFPRPVKPDAAVFLAALGDAYVSPQSVYKLHQRFEGSEIRYLPTGHVTSFLTQQSAMRDAISDSLRRL